MNETTFFYVQYNYEGEDIMKMLNYEGQFLIMNRDDIYTVDDEPIKYSDTKDFAIYYYNTDTEESRQVREFVPVFPNDEELKNELMVMVEDMRANGDDQKKIFDEVYGYLSEWYGKVDNDNLIAWGKKYLGFK